MSRDELAALYRIFVARAKAEQADVANEFRARYSDTPSHELIDEFQKRNDEALDALVPQLDVPASGK